MLGLGRALGETMAVTSGIGNMNQLDSLSLFQAANSITSALANEFAEASTGLHQASLTMWGWCCSSPSCCPRSSSCSCSSRRTKENPASTALDDVRRAFCQAQARNLLRLLAATFGLFWLFWILWETLTWAGGLAWATFTQMTLPPNEVGGIANALYGSFLMVMLATLVGTPIGILAGIYSAEYDPKGWLRR